jgi:hypothetical protein
LKNLNSDLRKLLPDRNHLRFESSDGNSMKLPSFKLQVMAFPLILIVRRLEQLNPGEFMKNDQKKRENEG